MRVLLPFLAFALFAAAIAIRSGRERGRRFVLPFPTRRAFSRPKPFLLVQTAGGLLFLGAMFAFAGGVRALGALLLGGAGLCFIHTGVTIAANKNGEADRFAERFWESQRIFLKNPRDQARTNGAALAILGGIMVFSAMAAL